MGNSIKDIRRKIKSIRSTRQITKAMELVATSKMKKAVDNAVNLRSYGYLAMQILNKLAKTLSLGQNQITNVNRDTISKTEIKEYCQNLLKYNDQILFIEANLHRLTDLFLLSISTELQEYRRVCLETLSASGEKGEIIWKKLMQLLHEFENKGFSPELKKKRLKLYPKTLAEGKKYFLHQNADIE